MEKGAGYYYQIRMRLNLRPYGNHRVRTLDTVSGFTPRRYPWGPRPPLPAGP